MGLSKNKMTNPLWLSSTKRINKLRKLKYISRAKNVGLCFCSCILKIGQWDIKGSSPRDWIPLYPHQALNGISFLFLFYCNIQTKLLANIMNVRKIVITKNPMPFFVVPFKLVSLENNFFTHSRVHIHIIKILYIFWYKHI